MHMAWCGVEKEGKKENRPTEKRKKHAKEEEEKISLTLFHEWSFSLSFTPYMHNFSMKAYVATALSLLLCYS